MWSLIRVPKELMIERATTMRHCLASLMMDKTEIKEILCKTKSEKETPCGSLQEKTVQGKITCTKAKGRSLHRTWHTRTGHRLQEVHTHMTTDRHIAFHNIQAP